MTFTELLAATFFVVFVLGLVISAIVGHIKDSKKEGDDAS